MVLNILADDLSTSAQSFFKDNLGFQLQKLSDQAISAEKFLGEYFKEDQHRKIERIFLTGYVGDESVSPENTFSSAQKRYKGMLLLTVELNAHSPNYTEIGQITATINRATPAFPVAVLYTYNKGARMALSCCEHFEFKQRSRIGERVGKTATLIDINIRKPSRAHQDLLSSLHLDRLFGDEGIETILDQWRERLRSSDRSLLSAICRNYITEYRAFPSLNRFDEIFGREAIASIRNTQGWGYYYNFLQHSVEEDTQFAELLDSSIIDHISRQIMLFQERHGIAPTPRIIQTQNRYRDLLLFDDSSAEAFLKKAEGTRKTQKSLHEIIQLIKDSVIGKVVPEEDEEEEEEENDPEDSDPAWKKDLPVINVSQEALDAGEYDDLVVSDYSISKEYRKFVFDYMQNHCAFKKVGDICKLSPDDARCFKSFNARRSEALQAIQSGMLDIVEKILFEREVDRRLDDFEDTDLDFEIDQSLTPRWLMPIGAGKGTTVLQVLQRNGYKPTVLELKNLPLGEFAGFKGIHQSRIEEYMRLKLLLPNFIEAQAGLDLLSGNSELEKIIDPRYFDEWEQVTVTKMFRVTRENRLRIRHLFIDYEDKELLKGVPKKWHFSRLDTWRLSLIRQKAALALYRENENAFIADESNLESFTVFESEFEQYFKNWLSTKVFNKNDLLKKYIFLIRHGIGAEKMTLQEIGDLGLFKQNTVCRERVRQLEAEAVKRLICSLPFQEKEVAQLIANKTPDTLQTELPLLFNLLGSSSRLLQRFLGLIANDSSLFLNIEESVLDAFFAQTPQPVSKHQTIKFIAKSLDEEDLASIEDEVDKMEVAGEVFDTLVLRCVIEVKGERVLPRKLHHKEAIAHIMAGEPTGLHLEDIIDMLKKLNYSNLKDFSYGRLKQLAAAPYLYLGGTLGAGTISIHKRFLPSVDEATLKELADWILEKIKAQPDKREDLRTIHNESPIGREWDYHIFRCFVRDLSEDNSFNFEGKSRADNVSLAGASEERIGNEERVFRLINQAKNGITLYELVQNFHCKSSALINLHLQGLLSSGKVMKLTPRLYITEKDLKKLLNREESEAYKSIPKALEDSLDQCEIRGQVLDARLVSHQINLNCLTDISNSLVQSRIASEARKNNWQMSYSLISRKELPYDSLGAVFSDLCTPDMEVSEAIELVSNKVATTEVAIKNAFYNFRQAATQH